MISDKYKLFDDGKSICRDCFIGAYYNKVVCSDGCKNSPIVLVVGEAPGSEELIQGKPFVGRAGRLLRDTMNKYGYNRKNTLITNTIPCRPLDNKFPKEDDIIRQCVTKWLLKEIEITNPEYILLVGATAMKFLLNKTGITQCRGNWYDINNILYLPTFHPSYVLRKMNEKDSKVKEIFENDIKAVAMKANFFKE